MSFPSATVILSNTMPREHQGVAASLVNTVVNYSISIGLGFAGIVNTRINPSLKPTQQQLLDGFRGAWYTGIILGGLGIVVSIIFVLTHLKSLRKQGGPPH
jgi:hypothetical protein